MRHFVYKIDNKNIYGNKYVIVLFVEISNCEYYLSYVLCGCSWYIYHIFVNKWQNNVTEMCNTNVLFFRFVFNCFCFSDFCFSLFHFFSFKKCSYFFQNRFRCFPNCFIFFVSKKGLIFIFFVFHIFLFKFEILYFGFQISDLFLDSWISLIFVFKFSDLFHIFIFWNLFCTFLDEFPIYFLYSLNESLCNTFLHIFFFMDPQSRLWLLKYSTFNVKKCLSFTHLCTHLLTYTIFIYITVKYIPS